MHPTNIAHIAGGLITSIHAIEHNTSAEGMPSWHFVGDVAWRDGSFDRRVEIPPLAICRGDDSAIANLEIQVLMNFALNYLSDAGEWIDDDHRAPNSGQWPSLANWIPRQASGKHPLLFDGE